MADMTTRSEALIAVLQSALGDKLAGAATALGEVTIVVAAENLLAAATALRDAPELKFEQLSDLCGADYRDYGDASASGEQGSRLRDANVRESGAALSSAGVASVSGVTSPKGAPVPPSDGALCRGSRW